MIGQLIWKRILRKQKGVRSKMDFLIAIIMSGLVSTIGLILILLIFGKLIIIQIQRWRLAKKGFVEVEHISETNIRRYFIMKPKANKFDLNDGFYFYIPDALTKGGDILKKYSKNFLTDDIENTAIYNTLSPEKREEFLKKVAVEKQQIRDMTDIIKNLNFKNEALSWKFGMPIITYYGDTPEPFIFRDKTKQFGSGVIKDAYLRLLMTQRFKDFQMFLIIGLAAIVITALALVGLWYVNSGVQKDLGICMDVLNMTSGSLKGCIDTNNPLLRANSTLILG